MLGTMAHTAHSGLVTSFAEVNRMSGFHESTRTRRYREGGWLGRRRKYICRRCGHKFEVDAMRPWKAEERVCWTCQELIAGVTTA